MLYVANVGEDEILSERPSRYTQQVVEYADGVGAGLVVICGRLEADIASLEAEERQTFLKEYGLEQSGLDKLIHAGYRLLQLITFFTVNPNEAHAWTVKAGATAPEAAGKVHSDFQKGFIKAEVYNFQDLDEYGSEKALREHGLIRQEGRDYVVQDGDILLVRFST